MKLCFVRLSLLVMVLLTAFGSSLSLSDASGKIFTESQRTVCAVLPGPEECLWAQVALLAERAAASNASARLGGVSLVRLPEDGAASGGETQGRGARALGQLLEQASAEASAEGRLRRLREAAGRAVLRLLRSRVLRVRLPDARTFRGAQRRLKKMLFPFLAGVVLKAAASLPLLLSALLAVGLKALLASNLALAITGAIALRAFLFSDSGGGGAKVSALYHHAHHEPLYHHAAEEGHLQAHFAHPDHHFDHSGHAGDLGVAAGSAQPYPYGRAMPGVDRLGWTPVAADRISGDHWSPLDVGLWRHSDPYDLTDHSGSRTADEYGVYSVTGLPATTSTLSVPGDEISGYGNELTISTTAEGSESAVNVVDSTNINGTTLNSGILSGI